MRALVILLLVANETTASFSLWMHASGNNSLLETATSRARLSAQFALTSAQLDMILTWINEQMFVYLIDPAIEDEFGVSTAEDLGYLQWGMCSVLRGGVTSIFSVDEFGTPYPEVSCC
jgi:hypothetical protein